MYNISAGRSVPSTDRRRPAHGTGGSLIHQLMRGHQPDQPLQTSYNRRVNPTLTIWLSHYGAPALCGLLMLLVSLEALLRLAAGVPPLAKPVHREEIE